MERGQNINTNRNLKEVDSKLSGWLCGFQYFSGGNNCRCGNSKRTRIKSGGGRIKTELLQSHDKSLTDEELLLSDEQRK